MNPDSHGNGTPHPASGRFPPSWSADVSSALGARTRLARSINKARSQVFDAAKPVTVRRSHPTLGSSKLELFIGCWLFDVGCWMFPTAKREAHPCTSVSRGN
jgi:hypothetical protein